MTTATEGTLNRRAIADRPIDRRVTDADVTSAADKAAAQATPDTSRAAGDAGSHTAIADSSRVRAAGSSAERTLAARFGEIVNVVDYGAVADDGLPDDAAFIAAQNAAFANADAKRNKQIRVPAGEYLITQAGALNAWSAATPYRAHVTIAGDGMWSTRIRFRPAAAGAYLYDGIAAPRRRLMFFTVRDLAIIADDTASRGTVNLFRQNGGADGFPDQAFAFEHVRFEGVAANPGIVLRIEGSTNGSENRFDGCRAYHWKSAISSANAQAVNHYVVASDFELMLGTIFDFTGGGQLTVVGGSYILASGGNGGAGGGLLRVASPAAGTGVASVFNFLGVRTENYDANAVMFQVVGRDNAARVVVSGGAHRTNPSGASFILAQVTSASGGRVTFRDVDLQTVVPWKVKFIGNHPGWYHSAPDAGTIVIEDSILPTPDVASLVRWEANAEGGLFRVRGARVYAPVRDWTAPAIAMDVDLTGPAGWSSGRHVNPVAVKAMSGFVGYWPNNTAGCGEGLSRIQLPAGAIIKAIRIHKIASSGDGSSYQLAAADGAGNVYGTSKLGRKDDAHSVMVENLNKLVVTEADRIVGIKCTPGNHGLGSRVAMRRGDMFIVEYY